MSLQSLLDNPCAVLLYQLASDEVDLPEVLRLNYNT